MQRRIKRYIRHKAVPLQDLRANADPNANFTTAEIDRRVQEIREAKGYPSEIEYRNECIEIETKKEGKGNKTFYATGKNFPNGGVCVGVSKRIARW